MRIYLDHVSYMPSRIRMLVHYVVKNSRSLVLKSASNICLSFAWITGPKTDPKWNWGNLNSISDMGYY